MVNFFLIPFHTFCQSLLIILLFYVPYTSPCQNGRTLHKTDLEPNDNAYLLDFGLLVQSLLVHKNLLRRPLPCLSQSAPALADMAI